MRQQTSHAFLGWLALTAFAISLSGCATWWSGWREGKSASLQTVQDDLQYAQLKTRETRAALSDLAFADGADLPRAYRAFRDEANTMNGAGTRLVAHANGMHYKGNSYLVEAESAAGQCRYPRLSKSARMPRMELGDAFEPIAEQGEQVQRALRSFAFDIAAIDDYLSRNLSEGGVRDMEIFFRRSEVDGDNLSYALEQALDAVERAETEYGKTAQGQAGAAPPQ
jgi:hypothetical protein